MGDVSSYTSWMNTTLIFALLSLLWMWQHKVCVSCVLGTPDDTWLTLAEEEAERSRDCVLIYYLASNLTVIICRLRGLSITYGQTALSTQHSLIGAG